MEKTPLDKAAEAVEKGDWVEAGRQMFEAARQERDFERSYEYLVIGESYFRKLTL